MQIRGQYSKRDLLRKQLATGNRAVPVSVVICTHVCNTRCDAYVAHHQRSSVCIFFRCDAVQLMGVSPVQRLRSFGWGPRGTINRRRTHLS
ncbi:hypothetical protein CRG98_026370 [Punica granatum]|uniref:Uncharacterized protein n=1 Tax=Punica granatum TaxID=22663 RepID=A0A2I0JAF9_PUNGR|nr:hypothetical protein CRG98_026370 [Punica granatum]